MRGLGAALLLGSVLAQGCGRTPEPGAPGGQRLETSGFGSPRLEGAALESRSGSGGVAFSGLPPGAWVQCTLSKNGEEPKPWGAGPVQVNEEGEAEFRFTLPRLEVDLTQDRRDYYALGFHVEHERAAGVENWEFYR